MKKIYIKPNTETVNVRLIGSILEDGENGYGKWSDVAGGDWGDAKENNLLFEDEGDFGDLWDDGDSSSNPYDLWGE